MLRAAVRRTIDGVFGFAARRYSADVPRILMYHRFGRHGELRRLDVRSFETQVRFIKRHFVPMRLLDLAQSISDARPLPRNAVVVTVDDGYEDFVTLAAPILRKHAVPATLFVVSDFVDDRIWLWYDAVHHACHTAASGQYTVMLNAHEHVLDLNDAPSRERAWEHVADTLLPCSVSEKWRCVADLADRLNVDLPSTPTPPYRAASWEQLRGLDPTLFEIGGHTKTHAIVSLCTADELACELRESKAHIERELGRKVRSFCYPNGQPSDYNEAAIRGTRDAGYECAVVAHGGRVNPESDVFALPRIGADERTWRFRMDLNGWSYVRGA